MGMIRRARQVKRTVKIVLVGGSVMAAGAAALATVGAGVAGAMLLKKLRPRVEVRGKVVLITGGSRGLGLAIAREFAAAGAKVAICARDLRELDAAREQLRGSGPEALAIQCDVSNNEDVLQMVRQVTSLRGEVDFLVNNAGVISVGPMESQNFSDYQEAMDVMFWGMLYPTLAVLPQMIARGSGHIANVTSIGGKVAVPHLLPYTAAKFAAVGFSEGLHAEVAQYGVRVTTVVPGLMRTGSFLNAYFKGQNEAEFAWFSLASSAPLLAMNGRRAARKIVAATRRGQAEIILTPQAKLLAWMNGLFPGATSEIMGLTARLMPRTGQDDANRALGSDSETPLSRSVLTHFGRRAAREFNESPVDGVNGKATALPSATPEPA